MQSKQAIKGARLSFQQARLWSLAQHTTLPSVQCTVTLQGKVSAWAFQQAFARVLQRHEILHTTFRFVRDLDVPMQVISPHLPGTAPLVDLSGLGVLEKSAQLLERLDTVQRVPCDPAQGPVVHAILFRIAPDRQIFFLRLSSLCADTSTLPALISELHRTYLATLHREIIAEQPLQYIDVVAWQAEQLSEPDAQSKRDFWQRIQAGVAAGVNLPCVHGQKETGGRAVSASRVVTIQLDGALLKRVSQQALRIGGSARAYLLACWQVLLWRLTGEQATIGVTCDGRQYEELAGALGPYSRVVPLNAEVALDQPFELIVQRVEVALRELIQHQDHYSGSDANGAHWQSLPIGYTYDTWPACWATAEGNWYLAEATGVLEPFALELRVLQVGDQLRLSLRYEEQYYSEQEAEKLGNYLRELLRHSLQAPECAVGCLRLLTDAQRAALWTQWVGPAEGEVAVRLHQQVEHWARTQPEAPALIWGEEQLSYAALNTRANQLGRALRARGVGAGQVVGICQARGIGPLVSLLGIWKAGGAYAVIEEGQPPERQVQMLRDLQPCLVLADAGSRTVVTRWGGAVLWMEEPWWAEASGENLPGESGPQDVACVIFTSGSTGQPRGVVITQGNVSHYARGIAERLGIGQGWGCATATTLAADLGNTAIYGGWWAGGCVHVLSYETVTQVGALQGYLRRWRIDLLKLVPTHLEALLLAGGGREVLPEEALVLGGERLRREVVAQVWAQGGRCRVYNHYGPTETTVGVLVQEVGREGEEVALGQPLRGSRVVVVDEQGAVVPAGVEGELWIGGAGVSQGYWRRTQESTQRYVQAEQERWYRSGDRVQVTREGALVYRGRLDGQVKVRGYRVEPGEIEGVLRTIAGVQEAVVLAEEGMGGGCTLVGYLVCGEEVGEEEVRGVLAARLPEYMLPQQLVRVRTLPRTANGKLDRHKLALQTSIEPWGSTHADQQDPGTVCVQPRDSIEHQLISLWEEILHRRPIGITDNFFDLGGHSMLAVRLMALLSEQFGQDLALATLFQHPTVEELAVILRQQVPAGDPQSALVPIQPRGTKRALFCVHPAGGTVFCYSNLARHLGAGQPFYGLQTPAAMTRQTHLRIEDIAARYIQAIRAVQPHGPYLLAGWSLGGIVAFEMARQLHSKGQTIALLAVIDSTAPDASAAQDLPELDPGDAHLAAVVLQSIQASPPVESFHQLKPEQQLAYALEESKRRIAIPRDTSLEQIRFLARARELNLHASRQYMPLGFPQRIELFLSEGSAAREEGAQAGQPGAGLTQNIQRWQALAGGGVVVRSLPGKHREIMEEPHVHVLATALAACIERIPG